MLLTSQSKNIFLLVSELVKFTTVASLPKSFSPPTKKSTNVPHGKKTFRRRRR